MNGVLYADKNRNGQQDPGEAIARAEVTIFGGDDSSEHTTTSDADGKFGFRDLAPGTYHPSYQLADGWVVHHGKAAGDLITVVENVTTEVTVRAERPYSEQLEATGSLDHDSYGQSASAKVTVTLTNTSDRPMGGIQARCNRDDSRRALGEGAGWSVLSGNGVSLQAGERRTITIVEELPQAARDDGQVTLKCDFAPNAAWNSDGPVLQDEAAVTGGTGGYMMVVGTDKNSDQRIDGDEAAKGVRVVLLHPQTGEQVAEGTSGADGKIEFAGLKIGDYRAAVLGSWAFDSTGQDQVRITEQAGLGYRFLKHALPAYLSATIKFEKPLYESHETARLSVVVKNTGGSTAERAKLYYPFYGMRIPGEQFGDFDWNGRGIRIPAGESVTFNLSGKFTSFGNPVTLMGIVDYLGRPDGAGAYDGSVQVVKTTGDIAGVVYVDRNGNGQQDSGEAAADTLVELTGGAPQSSHRLTTDADGRFFAEDLPSGEYWITYTLADGWIVHVTEGDSTFWLEPGPVVQLTGRAERPYSEEIKATLVLDKAVYAVGDEAQITVKVTNKGKRVLNRVEAACNRGDHRNFLGGFDDPMAYTWGDLVVGKGMTINPGETKTIVARSRVPIAAYAKNSVKVSCDFAPNVGINIDGSYAYDWGSVPGGYGNVTVTLAHDMNKNHQVDAGEAIPGTRVLLVTDREYGLPVAEGTSDAEGVVRLGKVTAGEYFLSVDGPWKFEGEYGDSVGVVAGGEWNSSFFVVPGPPPAPPGGGDPDPGTDDGVLGNTEGALAKTGASVLGLGAVAALLVAFGFAARVAGRRRT